MNSDHTRFSTVPRTRLDDFLNPARRPVYRWVVSRWIVKGSLEDGASFKCLLDCGHIVQSMYKYSRLRCTMCRGSVTHAQQTKTGEDISLPEHPTKPRRVRRPHIIGKQMELF